MTYFEDLTPYSFWPTGDEDALNVGWLEAGHDFPVGDVPEGTVDALLRRAAENAVNRTRGWHKCDLCAEPDYPVEMTVDGRELPLGDAEIRVTGRGGTVYAAPTLIAHYVAAHGYAPPREFVDGLLAGA